MRFSNFPDKLKRNVENTKPVEDCLSFEKYVSANANSFHIGLQGRAYYEPEIKGDAPITLTASEYRAYMIARLRALFPSAPIEKVLKVLNKDLQK